MKTSLFFAFLLVLFSTSFAQNKQKYNEHVDTASALYHSKEYKKSAAKYLEAFELLEGKAYPNDRYNAACSYALAQDTENAFYHLFRLAETKETHPKIKTHRVRRPGKPKGLFFFIPIFIPV